MKCENCKYWDKKNTKEVLEVGHCTMAKQLWDCVEWDEDCNEVQKAETAHLKAFVADGSDYRAYLFTKPDFGCVSFEAKEGEQ